MLKKVLVLLLGISLIIFGILKLKRDKAIEEPGYLKFMNGNSLVKENKTKEALEEYKLAMDTNEDINIKKNFEIIKNRVEEEKENQQDNQENKSDSQNSNEKKELTPEERAMKQKEEELRSIMQRLEGNEKQAFKNNERVLNTSENKNSENRW